MTKPNLDLSLSNSKLMGITCHARVQLPFMKKTGSHPPFSAVRSSKYPVQSIRAIPLRVLTVGKKRSQGIQLLVEEYKDKIKHYCSVEDVLIKSNPKGTSNVKAQIEAEDISIMQQLRPDDWVLP